MVIQKKHDTQIDNLDGSRRLYFLYKSISGFCIDLNLTMRFTLRFESGVLASYKFIGGLNLPELRFTKDTAD